MAYFVFKVRGDKSVLTLLDQFDGFKDAAAFTKAQRTALPPSDPYYIKMVHAADLVEAESLVTTFRPAMSPREEWE